MAKLGLKPPGLYFQICKQCGGDRNAIDVEFIVELYMVDKLVTF